MQTSSVSNNRIAKNTLLLYVRMLFLMAVTLYTSRVVLDALGVEDFGIYNVVGGVVTMFGFLSGCMSTVTQRYITFELGKGDEEQLQKTFGICVLLHIFMSVLILVLAETIGLWFVWNKMQIPIDRTNAAFWVYQCAVMASLIMIMSVPYNALIIAHEKMGAFAYISIFETVLKLAIVYVLSWCSTDKLILYAFLIVVVQLLIRLIYGIYCKRHFKESRLRLVWDRPLIKEMLGFGAWSIIGNSAYVAYTQGVNILLNLFFGPAVNAARGISVQVQNAVNMFAQNFQTAVNPQITKSYAVKDYAYMHQLIYRSGKFSFFLLLLLSLPIMIETDYVLRLWLTIVPDHTISFLRIMLCIVIIDSLSNPLMTSAAATGHIKVYHSVVGGIMLTIIPFSYLALKTGLPPECVFLIHLSLCFVALMARLLILRPLIHLSTRTYLHKVLLRCFIVTLIAAPTPILCELLLESSFSRFLLVGLLSIIGTAFSAYFIGLEKSEKVFIIKKSKTLMFKITNKHI